LRPYAERHAGDNPGKAAVDFIYVELRSAPTATLPANRPGIMSTDLVENPKPDAIRATADTGFSEPGGDNARLRSGDRRAGRRPVCLTADGKTTNTWKQGYLAFIGRNVRHESKNAGKPVDFVIVAIK
jgi:hypothetical protein